MPGCTARPATRNWRLAAAAGTVSIDVKQEEINRTLRIRIGLAASMDKLDLSECRLDAIPPEVLELTNLEVGAGTVQISNK